MNFFTRNRILIGAVILLAAINIATLATIGFNFIRPNTPQVEQMPRTDRAKFVAKQLNLTQEQEIQFQELRQKLSEETQHIRKEIREKHKQIMFELGKPEPSKIFLDSLANEIGNLHSIQQHATIDHFIALKSISTDEQYQQLQYLFKKMMSRDGMQKKQMIHQNKRIERRRNKTAE